MDDRKLQDRHAKLAQVLCTLGVQYNLSIKVIVSANTYVNLPSPKRIKYS